MEKTMGSNGEEIGLHHKEVHHGGHGIKSDREKGVAKYGDVKFADPEHGKFPIDTRKHIIAAEAYSRYAGPAVKSKIDSAARKAGIGDH